MGPWGAERNGPCRSGWGCWVAAVVAFTDEPQVAPGAVDNLEDPGTVAAAPEPPPAKVETGRIGDTLTISDRAGKTQVEVTVTRLQFSTGDGSTNLCNASIWVSTDDISLNRGE